MNRGQAIAEFSFVVYLLSFLLFSMLELGTVLNEKIVLTSAAREIARICAVEGGRTASAVDRLRDLVEPAGIRLDQVSLSISPSQAIYGTTIYVTVTYSHEFISPIVKAVAGSSVMLSAKAVTRSEFVPR